MVLFAEQHNIIIINCERQYHISSIFVWIMSSSSLSSSASISSDEDEILENHHAPSIGRTRIVPLAAPEGERSYILPIAADNHETSQASQQHHPQGINHHQQDGQDISMENSDSDHRAELFELVQNCWLETQQSTTPRQFFLWFRTIDVRCCEYLRDQSALLAKDERLSSLRLGDMRILEGHGEKASDVLAEFLTLHQHSLYEFIFCCTTRLSVWAKIMAIDHPECWPKSLQRVTFERLDLTGDETGRLLQRMFSDPQLQEFVLDRCSCQLPMFSNAINFFGDQSHHPLQLKLFQMSGCYDRSRQEGGMKRLVDAVLGRLMQLRTLQTLELTHQHLTSESLATFETILQHNSFLQSMDLSGNPQIFRGNDTETNAFLKAVRVHPSLQHLHLRRCGVRDELARNLFDALERSPLIELSLMSNFLTCSGPWTQSLPKLQHLRVLTLPHGMMASSEVGQLADTMQHNLSLHAFSFGGMVMDQVRPVLRRNQLYTNAMATNFPLTILPIILQLLGEEGDPAAIFPLLLDRMPLLVDSR